MTDVNEQNEGWGEDETGRDAPAPVTYPEYPSNPHNHRYTLSYDPQKPPFLVVRANTLEELQASFKELEDGGVYAAMGNAWRVMKAQASVGAGLGPSTPVPDVQGPPAAPMPPAPQGPNYNPQMPPPGVPGTAPAAWQNAGAPTPPPAPQGGGQWQGNGGGGAKPQPKQCPPGWYRTDKNSGPGADTWKSMRENNQQYVKGKISWGGGSTFWVSPDIAQWVHQQGFVVVPA